MYVKLFFNRFLLLGFIFYVVMASAEQITPKLWQVIKNAPSNSLSKRIDYFGKLFIGLPYGSIDYQKPKKISTLKEIEEYLFKPEYKVEFTKFDCVIFVETVLALSITKNSKSLQGFEKSFTKNLQAIRYIQGKDAYIYRNHFQSIDWNVNNSWLVKDITSNFPIPKHIARCNINKPEWLFKNSSWKEFLNEESKSDANDKKRDILAILQKYGVDYATKESEVKYLSIQDIVKNAEKIYGGFPEVAIINIVRPNWDIKKIIGTNLNISHVGFVIKKNSNLIFRHASSKGGVKELLLVDYLQRFIDSSTIKGINVLALSPQDIVKH